MEQTDDRLIWERAKQDGLTIVSKDSDFYQRAVLFGHPPKVIWIKRGNCPTKQVEFIREAILTASSDSKVILKPTV